MREKMPTQLAPTTPSQYSAPGLPAKLGSSGMKLEFLYDPDCVAERVNSNLVPGVIRNDLQTEGGALRDKCRPLLGAARDRIMLDFVAALAYAAPHTRSSFRAGRLRPPSG